MLALILPYARAIVPASLRGFLARIAPFSSARDMKYHADVVAGEVQELYSAKLRALKEGVEGSQIGQGQDILSALSKLRPQWLSQS